MKPTLTLRDLFWLIAIVAIGCAWWVDQRHKIVELKKSQQRAALWEDNAISLLMELKQRGMEVSIDEKGEIHADRWTEGS